MATHIINKDDTLPILKAQITDADGNPFPLPASPTSKVFKMIGASSHLSAFAYDNTKIDFNRYNIRLEIDGISKTIDVTKDKGVRQIVNLHILNDTSNVVTSPAATDQGTSETLANEIKTDYNLHIQNSPSTFHTIPDTDNIITAPDASDLSTLIDLVNNIKLNFNEHLTFPLSHLIDDSFNKESDADAVDLATSVTLLNSLKAKYNNHRVQANPNSGPYGLSEIIDNINSEFGKDIASEDTGKLKISSTSFGRKSKVTIQNDVGEVQKHAVDGLFGVADGAGDITGIQLIKDSTGNPTDLIISTDNAPAKFIDSKAADTSQLNPTQHFIKINIDGTELEVDVTGDGGNSSSYDLNAIVKNINTIFKAQVAINGDGRLEFHSQKKDGTSTVVISKPTENDVTWALLGIPQSDYDPTPITKVARQSGEIQYRFIADDTDTIGSFEGIFEITGKFLIDDVLDTVDRLVTIPLSESDILEIKVLDS